MSEKPFTKYLLRLATDPGEVARFRKGGIVARTSMEAAGLNADQIAALASGDQDRIGALVRAELPPQRTVSGATGVPVEIVCIIEQELDIYRDE